MAKKATKKTTKANPLQATVNEQYATIEALKKQVDDLKKILTLKDSALEDMSETLGEVRHDMEAWKQTATHYQTDAKKSWWRKLLGL